MLDPAALDGQGPEPPGSPYHCDSRGTAPPLRMVVMPRTEVNRIPASPFNRAIIQVTRDRIVARTIEVPAAGREALDVLYECSPSLEFVRATFSARYWEMHRALEAQGRVARSSTDCPDSKGPHELPVWEPQAGWKRLAVGSH